MAWSRSTLRLVKDLDPAQGVLPTGEPPRAGLPFSRPLGRFPILAWGKFDLDAGRPAVSHPDVENGIALVTQSGDDWIVRWRNVDYRTAILDGTNALHAGSPS